MRFDRKQQNSVKQLSFNKKYIKKKENWVLAVEGNVTGTEDKVFCIFRQLKDVRYAVLYFSGAQRGGVA